MILLVVHNNGEAIYINSGAPSHDVHMEKFIECISWCQLHQPSAILLAWNVNQRDNIILNWSPKEQSFLKNSQNKSMQMGYKGKSQCHCSVGGCKLHVFTLREGIVNTVTAFILWCNISFLIGVGCSRIMSLSFMLVLSIINLSRRHVHNVGLTIRIRVNNLPMLLR